METPALPNFDKTDLLLIGGSAGAFDSLLRIIEAIPLGYNKAVVIIIHRGKNNFTDIENLFGPHCRTKVTEVTDKETIQKGTVYIAPSNYHLLFEDSETFALDVSEAVWYSKPSIDVTFESAAEIYGNKCAAILLSGANADGAAGMLSLLKSGAITIAQNPNDAEVPIMPQAAIANKAARYILTCNQLLQLFN